MSHVHVLELNLLVDQVSGPQANTIVVDGDELGVGGIVELNCIGSVCSDWVSAEGLSSSDLMIILLSMNGLLFSNLP